MKNPFGTAIGGGRLRNDLGCPRDLLADIKVSNANWNEVDKLKWQVIVLREAPMFLSELNWTIDIAQVLQEFSRIVAFWGKRNDVIDKRVN
jgi:hypothetical protein